MPVLDPLPLAREACALQAEAKGNHFTAKRYRRGQLDNRNAMATAVASVGVALETAALIADAVQIQDENDLGVGSSGAAATVADALRGETELPSGYEQAVAARAESGDNVR